MGTSPRLIGGQDRDTGRITFPCPADRDRFDPVELPANGTLWSWTIQRFRPKSPPYRGPEDFEPFAVGYVELPDAVIVESILVDVAFDALKIGMPMELVLIPFLVNAAGQTVKTYAFRPATAGDAA